MKCITCKKGIMEKVKDRIAEDNIEFEALKCSSCGEEIMNMPQLKSLAGEYRKLRKAKEITFTKWGNSIAVRIPREITKEFNIISGGQGILTKEKEGIKIIPLCSKKLS
ncbi:MAG TPA: hypothetical protein VJH95_05690 [Candidatus Nanoarchaeia archaeon]|nr:hypothetical protein [Candidatus Nanoarchaeia archaeon]